MKRTICQFWVTKVTSRMTRPTTDDLTRRPNTDIVEFSIDEAQFRIWHHHADTTSRIWLGRREIGNSERARILAGPIDLHSEHVRAAHFLVHCFLEFPIKRRCATRYESEGFEVVCYLRIFDDAEPNAWNRGHEGWFEDAAVAQEINPFVFSHPEDETPSTDGIEHIKIYGCDVCRLEMGQGSDGESLGDFGG
ncbi:unnamed protein product [Periconia digitata]|uniref:Uncharacterized protein n=1 Tax=Periconia digitata TaxID=1303443 RepID=A0A9W4XI06_9PLEO|nr:unnamed protein product [Periconia digitata]